MQEKIIIVDFGSQYTQLIGRVVRSLQVYCEIVPFYNFTEIDNNTNGIILSGSPASVNDENFPTIPFKNIINKIPMLGICYGAQLIAKELGGTVNKSNKREYGRAQLQINSNSLLFNEINNLTQIWMSHSDSIVQLPSPFKVIASTNSIPIAAFSLFEETKTPIFGVQFHPEVYHSTAGKKIFQQFLTQICNCSCTWTAQSFIEESIQQIKSQVGEKAHIVMALSGGVDSTVAATLITKAIGNRLHGIFVDNGLLRKDEFNQVLHMYHLLGIHVIGVDKKALFYTHLQNITDPETKRKTIGKLFIDVFQSEAQKLQDIQFLGQGTIYPDIIESNVIKGIGHTIKSHHNVGGLPAELNLKLIEPLKYLFKDEVRKVGYALNLPEDFIERHPFPGPGLGIRIIGDVTAQKVQMLQQADYIFIQALKKHDLYKKVWQAGVILLPIQSVGVMGDERTYELTVALRAVTSVDGMTADWADLPHHFLAAVSNEIINQVKGINRVVYDISSKPPATIEWE
ncbi:MAG: glutamine-hydrolyzing GMP synthase [Sediminibacterium sp.]|nr:glutamine-hydrolyzing GMP synthase [Sediminibacterium sp.]